MILFSYLDEMMIQIGPSMRSQDIWGLLSSITMQPLTMLTSYIKPVPTGIFPNTDMTWLSFKLKNKHQILFMLLCLSVQGYLLSTPRMSGCYNMG